jgi:hypothetical protein
MKSKLAFAAVIAADPDRRRSRLRSDRKPAKPMTQAEAQAYLKGDIGGTNSRWTVSFKFDDGVVWGTCYQRFQRFGQLQGRRCRPALPGLEEVGRLVRQTGATIRRQRERRQCPRRLHDVQEVTGRRNLLRDGRIGAKRKSPLIAGFFDGTGQFVRVSEF